MTRICLDAATVAKLSSVIDDVELCDEGGNLIGRFMPDEHSPAVRAWLQTLDHGLTEEEIQRICSDPDSMTTDELIAHLRSGKP